MHVSVLLKEAIKYLEPKPGKNFVDCTIGAGGHSLAILEKNNPGKVLAIDWDKKSLQFLKSKVQSPKSKVKDRLILVNDNFKNLKQIVKKYNFGPVDGILFDLGLSSWQLEEGNKGFSFKKDEPLLMNYESGIMNHELTAGIIINQWPEDSLIEVFSKYGEERYSRRIARQIIQERKRGKIETTFQLGDIVRKAIPVSKTRRGGIDRVLARVFQSLRIIVNDELENLRQALGQALEVLKPGGRLVVISFHSLEDRIVKQFFKEGACLSSIGLRPTSRRLEILTKKPITASEEEVKNNPRSRSAKLRAIVKIKNREVNKSGLNPSTRTPKAYGINLGP